MDNRIMNENPNNSPKMLHHFDELDVDLRRLLMLLWRRKWVVMGIVVVTVAVAAIISSLLPTRYTAQSLVMIESESINPKGIELQNFMSEMRLDTALVLSEVEVLKSRETARRVIMRLNMMAEDEPSSQSLMTTPAENETEFKSLSVYRTEMTSDENPVLSDKMNRAIAVFQNNLAVKPVPGSYVIQISYTSGDPQRAALVANIVMDVYMEQRLEEKFLATQKVTNWLDNRLTALREQVRQSEKAVEDYRSRNNLIEGARFEMTAQQLSELNTQLVLAKSKRAEALARLNDTEGYVANSGVADASPDVLNARYIQDLKRSETELLQQKADLSSRYGPKHPTIIKINAELADLRSTLRRETQQVADAVRAEYEVADARVEELQKALAEMQGQKRVEYKAMIDLRELTREAESNRLIFDNFLETYKRSDQREQLEEPEARVLSYASVPEDPSYPNKPLIISLAAAISLFLGIAFVLILEKLDNAFRSASQLEQRTGYPCFGLIPAADSSVTKHGIADYIIKKPSSAVAESIRTLRMVLNLRSGNDEASRPRVVTVTSSLPAEGKTTISAWLGRVAAKSGEKVIVIDCDLRRPNLHRVMKMSNEKTLVDYLTGDMKLNQVVNKDDPSGAHIICARAVANSALDLISSEKMRKLIKSLKETYDLVILDTPAALAVSDARILASESDFTLYIVEWDKTPREVVTTGVKQFSDFGYENLAFVLSGVDVRRHARYGYGDTAYYYGRYREYYQE